MQPSNAILVRCPQQHLNLVWVEMPSDHLSSLERIHVLVIVPLHPLVFGDLSFKARLVGALVELLDTPMLKPTLFHG